MVREEPSSPPVRETSPELAYDHVLPPSPGADAASLDLHLEPYLKATGGNLAPILDQVTLRPEQLSHFFQYYLLPHGEALDQEYQIFSIPGKMLNMTPPVRHELTLVISPGGEAVKPLATLYLRIAELGNCRLCPTVSVEFLSSLAGYDGLITGVKAAAIFLATTRMALGAQHMAETLNKVYARLAKLGYTRRQRLAAHPLFL